MKLLIATHNLKKQAEMQRILSPLGFDVLTAEMAGVTLTDVEETGKTFRENAYLKAKSGCDETGLPCVADDSGLCVDALGGAPGVFSARFSGVHGNDDANIDKLLQELQTVPKGKRSAHFACAVCLCFPNGRVVEVEGRCSGRIGFERHGQGGFGYDPVFMVGEKSFAELTKEEKDRISHRGDALQKLAAALKQEEEKE
ncbi:MAG: RdgB/HAM1 family non-canonical purine NTP pyrophosphatase [Clostridia bacterium]|nr:RdgB/HAM1 family non-canonical purine NTP pyrophosphatase [Clostridia bacterium]MBR3553210.1 RdgB/HAM1 family non-canonical purine NTP pyrophosphatase [Clostridia bacterium]